MLEDPNSMKEFKMKKKCGMKMKHEPMVKEHGAKIMKLAVKEPMAKAKKAARGK